jgi:nucleoside-diphosphate-sugar epimerase
VIDTYQPFVFDIKDTRRDLLDPAINGAVMVLEATAIYGAGSVRRVVTTASFASNLDLLAGKRPNYTYTEQDWNPMTYEEATKTDPTAAYCASKALAERSQWDWMEANNPGFDLVALCPAWIFGPHVAPPSRGLKGLNQSSAALWRMVDRDELPVMDFMGFVDVRDNAIAHVGAFETPEAGGERFILAHHFDYQSVADAVRESIPELRERIPKGTPGSGWQELESGGVYSIDTSKAQRVLGVKYTPFRVSMTDSFLELLEAEKKTA